MKHSVPLLFSLLLAGCGNFGLDEEQLLQRAKQFLSEREYIAAAIEARNTLQKNPDNPEARYLLGVITLDYGDYSTAAREFRLADLAGWGDGLARIGRARAMLELGLFQELIAEVELETDYSVAVKADLLALRAAAEASLEETDKARATLREAVALDPSAFQVLMTRIQLLLDEDDLQEATDEIETALESYPGNPELLFLQAKIALVDGDVRAGKQVLQAIIDSEAHGFMSIYAVNARLYLVQQLILEDNTEEARRYLAPLFGRTANAPYTNYLGGLLAFELGEYDLAERRLLKVMKVAPDHPPTRLLFATVNFAQQDYEQAAYFLSKYLATNPGHLAARKLLGRSYMQLNQPGQARQALQPAMADDTDDAELLTLVGLSELRSGDAVAGIAGLRQALAADASKVSLRKELASIYMTTGETGLAIQELQALIDHGGNEQEALLIIGSLRNGEFEWAISSSLDLLASNPQDPVIISLAGNVFAASGDYQEARRYLEQALSVRRDFFPATLALARIEELEGKTDRAIVLYRNLVKSHVDSVVPVLALARLEGQQGNTQQVIDILQAASKEFPEESRPRLLLAEHYLRDKQYQKARLLLEEAAATKQGQPVVLFLQARLLIATERYQEAVTVLTELLEIDPDSTVTQVLLAEAHLHMGGAQHAREVLQTVIRQHPDDIPALALMTRLEILSGNLDQAMRHSQRIQQEYPELYLGYELLGDVRVAKKDDVEAGKQYEQAWERMRRSELAIKRAEVALRSGADEAAVEPLLFWLGEHPGDDRVRRFLGATYHDSGRDEQAIAEYLRVLAMNPADVAVLNNLAWIYFHGGNPAARNMAERAYRIAPDNAGVLDTYGWILVHEDDVEKGTQLLRQASKQLQDVAEVRYHYAVALHLSGDQQQAREILEALLADGKPFDGREQARQLLVDIAG
ncbi:MAG: XrtA/PEP-CTERM system TPR-repeat protein PrsT [Gammaproteobacteria bacterium]